MATTHAHLYRGTGRRTRDVAPTAAPSARQPHRFAAGSHESFGLLHLQRCAGNQACVTLLGQRSAFQRPDVQRDEDPGPPELPDPNVFSCGIKEDGKWGCSYKPSFGKGDEPFTTPSLPKDAPIRGAVPGMTQPANCPAEQWVPPGPTNGNIGYCKQPSAPPTSVDGGTTLPPAPVPEPLPPPVTWGTPEMYEPKPPQVTWGTPELYD